MSTDPNSAPVTSPAPGSDAADVGPRLALAGAALGVAPWFVEVLEDFKLFSF
jgi:hypothetical protein